nr:phosphonopyruvate decarboxylase [Gammaproteobacteria bacterium]
MMQASDFLIEARNRGLRFFSGVPCSFLTPLMNGVIRDTEATYIGATSEGEAVAIAAGAWLAGQQTVVMCQNSGLGNTINPLTSLNWPFRIPTLLMVTWRGQPGLNDEPQHELMGRITERLLSDIQVPHRILPGEAHAIAPALDEAMHYMRQHRLPYAFIVGKGTVSPEGLEEARLPLPPPGELVDFCSGG